MDESKSTAEQTSEEKAGGLGRLRVQVTLFVATCITTVWAGTSAQPGEAFSIAGGLSFGGTLMVILICHEMGHYLVARHHRIDASLPYFIPLPPQISLGTLGAIIRMRQPISDRNQLLDVGAAGPFAGLAVAIPLLFLGLSRSSVGPIPEGAYLEGNSLLYIAIKYAVFGKYLPTADGWDVVLHPMAFAAWVGLLITMINLIPVGQLDGGHIACGALGKKHENSSRWVHGGLLVVATVVTAGLAWEGLASGRDGTQAVWHGLRGGLPWLVWAGILSIMRRLSGGNYHPPVGHTPLTSGRRRLVWLTAVVFVAIVTPVPLRPALTP